MVMRTESGRGAGPGPSGTDVGPVVDLAPEGIRAYSCGAVVRSAAAVFSAPEGLVYGAEAVRRSGEDLGAFEGRLPDFVDEQYVALGGRVFALAGLVRGLVAHAVASAVTAGAGDALADGAMAGSSGSGGPDCAGSAGRLTIAVPQPWTGVRRGVIERAAEGLCGPVRVVGSSVAARCAADREGLVDPGRPAVVAEQWRGCAVACVVPPGASVRDEPSVSALREGLVLPGPGSGGVTPGAIEDLIERAGDDRHRFPILVVPRAGGGVRAGRSAGCAVEGAGGPARVHVADPDIVLRGARLIAAA